MLFDQLLTSVFIKIDVVFFPKLKPQYQFVVTFTLTHAMLPAHSGDPTHSHRPRYYSREPALCHNPHSHSYDHVLVGGVVAYCHCSRAHGRRGMWSLTSSTTAIGFDKEASQSSLSSFSTSLFNFSYGNRRIKETRGLMHLFPDDTPLTLVVSHSPPLFIIVPFHF